MSVRSFQVVRCVRCGHVWDDEDMDDFVCPCLNDYGYRQVVVLSEGTTNTPKLFCVDTQVTATAVATQKAKP